MPEKKYPDLMARIDEAQHYYFAAYDPEGVLLWDAQALVPAAELVSGPQLARDVYERAQEDGKAIPAYINVFRRVTTWAAPAAN